MNENKAIVNLLESSDKQLMLLSKKNCLSLSLEEMKAVKKYFASKKRNPTDVELETLAQTWSEHCKHKTLAGAVEYTEVSGGKTKKIKYKNLLKETVFRATTELDHKWCISVFKDNAGVIEFDKNFGIAFKVETHNHPSALEPYGGAATGIGGVIRDILGVGLGAKPLANTDVFCFGRPDYPWSKLPKGMLHPKRIAKGVISGVRDYGNRMGIPTVNGAVYFDDAYTSNPLVYCGTVGIIPKKYVFKKVSPGELVLVVGGRTGRDGIHGATFSSIKLDQDSDVTAVQIGNPIVEKKVMDTMLKARDLELYSAVTDCGAGGLSSAIGELGEECGVRVHLDKVPLKYAGLRPWEIWVSEAQERMVFSVPKKNREKILEVFRAENVEADFIGEFTDDKCLKLIYKDEVVCDMSMEFLHKGVPKQTNTAFWQVKEESVLKTKTDKNKNYGADLKKLLSSLNICSRAWIIRQYDHEVQGQSVVKPLHGSDVTKQGPGDAAVIWPYTIEGIESSAKHRGIAVSNGMNPEFGKIDAYWMAASAIDEALRNAVCVGANPEKVAILDNFCWGNPYKKEVLGSLVRAAQACYDFSKIYGAPFISGKDSLHNEYKVGEKHYSIPPSLLISAMAIVEDVRKTITMDLKQAGNKIYLIGETKDELGGSHYYKESNIKGGILPKVDAKKSLVIMKKVFDAISKGMIASCHDCSEGGLAVTLAEMAFAGKKGVNADISSLLNQNMSVESVLFSESNSRFVVEVEKEKTKAFEKHFAGLKVFAIGEVSKNSDFIVKQGSIGKILIKENLDMLYKVWSEGIKW